MRLKVPLNLFRCLILVFGILAGAPEVRAGPLQQLESSVREIRLPNGAVFLLVHHGATPTVATVLRFTVGGIEEEPGQSGLAHFFEHLAFKGSSRVSVDELWRVYQRNGGLKLNATTSKDLTTYVVSLPSNRIGLWSWIDSDRILHPIYSDFDAERKVVIEERRQRIDNRPAGRLWEEFMKRAFAGRGPYAIPTIGLISDLEGLTVEQAKAFHERYYRPNRLTGAVVGNFNVESAASVIRREFGVGLLKAPPVPPLAPWAPQTKEERFETRGDEGPLILIGYHKPTLPHRDDYVFDLISEVLGGGRTSRLYKALIRSGKAVAFDVDTSIPASRLHNLMVIEVSPNRGTDTEEVLDMVDREVDHLKTQPVPTDEIETARKRILSNILWSLDENDSLASLLTYYQAVAGDWRYLTRYPAEIESVSAEEMIRVARKYLVPGNRTIGILERS